MSADYASGLSKWDDKGVCGLPEYFDSSEALKEKLEELFLLIRDSKHLVVHTGAGISTSCGIPDFRGPNDIVKYLITQNVDGLHLRSGFPRDRLSLLHGDMFVETCNRCGTNFIRSTQVTTVGLKSSGLACTYVKPDGRCCRLADVHLCVGTSLQMHPAAELPLMATKSTRKTDDNNIQSKLVIVNLQKTPLDKRASLVIRAPADQVFASLCTRFGLSLTGSDESKEADRIPIVLRSRHTQLYSSSKSPSTWPTTAILPHPTASYGLRLVVTHNPKLESVTRPSPVKNVAVTADYDKSITSDNACDTKNDVKRLKMDC